MLSQLRPALTLLAVMTVVLGLLYPAAMTAVALGVLPKQASGSLVMQGDRAVGSSLIGQAFTDPRYLLPRPSAAGTGYDASASSGTNLGPTSAKLAERLKTDSNAMKAAGVTLIPADAITTSGSGLDPDISPAYAALQVTRIAGARGVPVGDVQRVVGEQTAGRTFGILGEPRVNVLAVNIALDALPGQATPVQSPPAVAPAAVPGS